MQPHTPQETLGGRTKAPRWYVRVIKRFDAEMQTIPLVGDGTAIAPPVMRGVVTRALGFEVAHAAWGTAWVL